MIQFSELEGHLLPIVVSRWMTRLLCEIRSCASTCKMSRIVRSSASNRGIISRQTYFGPSQTHTKCHDERWRHGATTGSDRRLSRTNNFGNDVFDCFRFRADPRSIRIGGASLERSIWVGVNVGVFRQKEAPVIRTGACVFRV
jgi:hypothetical protein